MGKFFEWADSRREDDTSAPLISRLRSGFYHHREDAADADADGGGCALALCAPCFMVRTQVFIRSARRLPSGAFVRVNHCGRCGCRSANIAAPPTESALELGLYGGKLVPNRTAEHFSSTHLLLTPFNLLTYINSFGAVNSPCLRVAHPSQ